MGDSGLVYLSPLLALLGEDMFRGDREHGYGLKKALDLNC